MVTALPDSGYFLDWAAPQLGGERSFGADLRGLFAAINGSGGVNGACVAAHAAAGGRPDSCIFAEPGTERIRTLCRSHTAPFLRTPSFFLQSAVDLWQLGQVLGSTNASVVNPFARELTDRLLEYAIAPGGRHSGF
eukprot:gene39848-58114_t